MNPRDEGQTAKALVSEIRALCEKEAGPIRIMEVCGTHTMAIAESGIKSLFPENLTLVSGPGCPVCVTETQFIDEAIAIGEKYDACLATFGDLVRIPGSNKSLAEHRSEGGRVNVVYSAMDTIALAAKEAPRPVVFLGVGFETTIPTVAATLKSALRTKLDNLYVLPAFKTIHPPLKILAQKDDLHGFLLPGHVSVILGTYCFRYLSDDFGKSGVVAGFEPLDILLAVRDVVKMRVQGTPDITNAYKRVVRDEGNAVARELMYEVFEPADATWRGLGVIPGSGLAFRPPYDKYDARIHTPVEVEPAKDDPRCQCAAILTGSLTPDKCGLFRRVCAPERPIGPCMVSSEGTCAAYYKYT